ncbi:MAG TPA: GNAT family N-acetyltransferase [Pyrinomonadaceae bacterium]
MSDPLTMRVMEVKVFQGRPVDAALAERILALDRKNMLPVLARAGVEFPEANRRRGLAHNPTLIVAFAGQAVAGYLEYTRSWRDPAYIYVGSIQIDAPYRHTDLLLRLLAHFQTLAAAEDFLGFETNVQKSNDAAVRLYRKLGFQLTPNPDNDASWLARAGRELLTDSPAVPLLTKWRARRAARS